MRIAICTHDDNQWGSLSQMISSFYSSGKDTVVIEEFSSKEAFAKKHVVSAFDIMICCFEGTEGLETIALAKRSRSDIQLIWLGENNTFSPCGYRIRVVDYIEGPHVKDQLKGVLFGKQNVIQYPVYQKERDTLCFHIC
ncbi:hypothetical protein [Anaerosporobacter faecicola]|uniref:hypothetical protein n=1 Tax=Anaerosporobacter faecicola TaxID=2718714 RepID=UPI001438966D|nr:hypothetical protein [Anaerosporobacter faecicola]